jgi:hypothetical protein
MDFLSPTALKKKCLCPIERINRKVESPAGTIVNFGNPVEKQRR